MKKTKQSKAISTYLSPGVSVVGTITFEDTIRLDGKVEGKIVSKGGTVIVGEKAVLHADISADVVIIMGEIHGTVDARQRIEAFPPGSVSGDITAPVIAVEPGVVFDGNCTMKGRAVSPETLAGVQKTPLPIGKAKRDGEIKPKREEKVAENL